MKITQFDPGMVLGNGIIKMGRQELCEFVSKLCRRVVAEVGTRGRRGGIYPANISIDAQGEIGIGPSGAGPWEGEELKFVAPELYWNGQCSAASDVYSVGMMLYYAVSGGRLPLEDECRDAQLRRMGGDNFAAPRSAGRRLGEIIEKAIRFKSAERYQTLEELRVVLDSCVKNLYLSGAPSAEVIFKKNDDDLSAVERMMVGIIEKEEGGDAPEEDEVSSAESVKVYAPAKAPGGGKSDRSDAADEMIRKIKSSERPAAPKLSEENNPFFLDPVAPARRGPNQNTQYTRNAEREKKIADEVKKRRRRPLAVILVLCAVLVVVAIIFNSMLKDFQQAKQIPDNTIAGMDQDPYAGTTPPQTGSAAADGSGLEVIGGEDTATPEESTEPAPSASPAPATPAAHSYELILEDVSWTQARDKCIAKGGHLVVIGDKEEFDKVVALAEEKGVDKVWIGCHRVDGELVWETDETGYLSWAKGEPSYVDVNDDVAEDYIMLWNNKGWAYNDNRNDPIADYPQWYSGTVAYICEYGG